MTSTTVRSGGLTIELLEAGEQLKRGGTVAAGDVAVRVDGHELAGHPDAVADHLRQLFGWAGGVALPNRTWQILVVGDAVSRNEFYGPFPGDDPGTRAYSRIRALEVDDLSFVQADLRRLDELRPMEPGAAHLGSTATVPADVEVPGAGTLHAGATYIAACANGVMVTGFALAGRELIEAYEFRHDGTPDWSTASICESDRGEQDFYYPAVALLRWLNDRTDLPVWHHALRAEFDATFAGYGTARLIAGWSHDEVSGGYRITVWQQGGGTAQVVLRTPDQANAFVAGLQAAVNAPGGVPADS